MMGGLLGSCVCFKSCVYISLVITLGMSMLYDEAKSQCGRDVKLAAKADV